MLQIDATETQFTNPLKEYILYADAIKVALSCLAAVVTERAMLAW